MQFIHSPDYKIFNEIIELRRKFLGIMDWGHPRYEHYSYPQRLCLLSDMNRVYILREVGDLQKYLEFEREIAKMAGKSQSPQDEAIFEMAEWTDKSIKAMQPFKSDKPRIALSLLVYGKEYASKCLDVALKSLMTEGNLFCLCKEMQVIFHVQTDNATRHRII